MQVRLQGGRSGYCFVRLGSSGRSGNQLAPRLSAAPWIVSAITRGWVAKRAWLAETLVIFAPIRSAM